MLHLIEDSDALSTCARVCRDPVTRSIACFSSPYQTVVCWNGRCARSTCRSLFRLARHTTRPVVRNPARPSSSPFALPLARRPSRPSVRPYVIQSPTRAPARRTTAIRSDRHRASQMICRLSPIQRSRTMAETAAAAMAMARGRPNAHIFSLIRCLHTWRRATGGSTPAGRWAAQRAGERADRGGAAGGWANGSAGGPAGDRYLRCSES